MAKRPQQTIIGDVVITGNLEVIEGINDIQITDVATATEETDANTVVLSAELSDLADDSKLTPAEKLIVKKEWLAIAAMHSEVLSIATQNGIDTGDTEYDAYVTAYNALDTYLNNDPAGVIFNMSVTTDIVANTFRTKFSDYYETREALVIANRTTTPETPLGSAATAVGRNIVLEVLPQIKSNGYTATLANFRCWDVQVSDDQINWYSLRFDGVDWKGTLDQYTTFYSPSLIHSNIPNAGTPPAETGKTLYYRIRTVTDVNAARGVESSYAAALNATTEPSLSYNETIPPLNGAITNLAGDTYAQVTITFTVGDDTHGATYGAGEYSGLAGHKLWRRLNADGSDTHVVGDTGNATDTTFLDISSVDGVAYDYGISAYDVNGNESTITWYGTPITPQYTAVPDTVANLSVVAYPDRILLQWDSVGGPIGPYIYDVERGTGGGYSSLLTDHETNSYEDPVAEATEFSVLSGYKYRVVAQDKYGNLSGAWTEVIGPTRHQSFGTWAPETVGAGAIHASGDKRSISATVDAMGEDTPADFTDDLIWADGLSIQISINDSNWFAPNFEASGSTDVNRWYTGLENDFTDISELSFVLQNMPLTNEANLPVSAETYYLRFRYKRKSGSAQVYSAAWSSSISVVCTATGAKDLVANAIHQATIDMSDWLILQEGPVAYWSLNDVGLDQVDFQYKDNSGNGHHATGNELIDSAVGPGGPCIDLDGDSMYLTVPDHADFDFERTDPFSVLFWINGPVTGGSNLAIINKLTWGVGQAGWRITTLASNVDAVSFLIADNHTVDDVEIEIDGALDNTLHFIAVTYDGNGSTGGMKGYLDGNLVASGGGGSLSTTIQNAIDVTIGAHATPGAYFDGKLAHIRIFDSVLGQGAIKWLMQNPAGNIPGMVLADTMGAGQIFAEHLSVLSRQLVNNPTETAHVGGWGHHEENGALMSGESTALTLEDVTYQSQTVKAMQLTNNWRWGVRSKSFPISQNKIYKISVTMKSSAANGLLYIGSIGASSAFEADEGGNLNWAGSLAFNRYYGDDYAAAPRGLIGSSADGHFIWGITPPTSFTTYTMYFIGMDRDISECQKSEGPNSANNRTFHKINDSRITHCGLRILLWDASVSRSDDYINWSVTEVGSGTIVAENILANAITAAQIAAGAIDTDELAAGAVTADKIEALAIEAGKIAAGAVDTAELAAGAVTADKIEALAIEAGKIAAGAVDTAELAAGAVTADEIAAGIIAAAHMNVAELFLITLQSTNYVAGSAGYKITRTGVAEFQEVEVRGEVYSEHGYNAGAAFYFPGDQFAPGFFE